MPRFLISATERPCALCGLLAKQRVDRLFLLLRQHPVQGLERRRQFLGIIGIGACNLCVRFHIVERIHRLGSVGTLTEQGVSAGRIVPHRLGERTPLRRLRIGDVQFCLQTLETLFGSFLW